MDVRESIDKGDADGEIETLKRDVLAVLKSQGFKINGSEIYPDDTSSKDSIRELHKSAVAHKRELAKKNLARHEDKLINNIANGHEVIPQHVMPYLIEVKRRSEDERLFRYASLHWSIPVSSGYGRRLRFLVRDAQNDKLIGIIGLGDPVFSLRDRDNWIGWDSESKKLRLHNVVDAFVLGAVPPYSNLLCGKLVALLATSNEIRNTFRQKYANRKSLIQKRQLSGEIALITTASALGKSSIYRRLKFENGAQYISCGFTSGSGEFHFSNGIYSRLAEFVGEHCQPSAKNEAWGTGFRNRREVVRKALKALGLSSNWIYHGVTRELFVVPTAENTQSFLQGKQSDLRKLDLPLEKLFSSFRSRWLLPRSERVLTWREFQAKNWYLWNNEH